MLRFAAIFAVVAIVSAARVRAQESAPAAEEDERRLLAQAIDDAGIDLGRVQVYGHIQLGATFNPDDPRDRQNFGRLFDDRSNDFRFNQLLLTVEQALEPEAGEYDWGFKVQTMFGSDARFVHALGFLDQISNDDVQLDFNEVYLNVHTPWLTDGGIDFKAGIFVTLCGAEVIDASANPLYSHSYIFNFAIPFKHSGLLVTTHVTDDFDVFTGVVTGINTGLDDNNGAPSFHGGMNARFLDGDLNFYFSAHYGPENDSVYETTAGIDSDGDARTIFDLVIAAKPCENLTLIADMVYAWDDAHLGIGGETPEWYGVALYAIYGLTDWCDLVVRGETFRDDDGFVVAQFAENDDLIDLERGRLDRIDPRTVGGGATTYYALTLGANFKSTDYLVISAEVRWDWSSGGNRPFDDSSDGDQFTAGVSMLFKF